MHSPDKLRHVATSRVDRKGTRPIHHRCPTTLRLTGTRIGVELGTRM
jgi:hypothetical protein